MADTNYSFPKENENPKVKAKKPWLLQFVKAAVYTSGRFNEKAIGAVSASRYNMITRYVLAEQDTTQYKKMLSRSQDASSVKLAVDWTPRSFAYKLRRVAVERVLDSGYDIIINPIDPLAQTELRRELSTAKAKALLREAAAGDPELMQSPALRPKEGEPEDLAGVEISELGARHRTAMEAEMVVESVFNQNDYAGQRRSHVSDLFDFGVTASKDSTEGYYVGVRRCDPRMLLLSHCRYPDFSDLKYVGEVMEVPVSQLEAMGCGEISQEDIDGLYKNILSMAFDPSNILKFNVGQYDNAADFSARGKVFVVDLELKTTDVIRREDRKSGAGNPIYDKVEYEEKETERKKIKDIPVQRIYRCKWVVGTDILFDYGLARNQKRDPKNKACAQFSFHIATSEFSDMRAYSRMESLIPYINAAQIMVYKIEDTLQRGHTGGYAFDLDALEDIAIGAAGGDAMSPKDLIDMFMDSNVIVSRSKGGPYGGGKQNGNGQVATWIDGFTGKELVQYWDQLRSNIQMMKDTLGLNDVTDGSTPNSKNLTSTTEAAINGTNNALGDLYYGIQALEKALAESVVIRSQDIIRDGKGEAFAGILGSGSVKWIKGVPDIDKYTYGVVVVPQPSRDEELLFQQDMTEAMQLGMITIADKLFIRNIKNLKQKQDYLAYKVRKNQEKAQQNALQQQQQTGQIQQQSAQMTAQLKLQEIQADAEAKKDIATHQHALNMEEEVTKGNYLLEAKRIDATGRVESADLQAQGRSTDNLRNNLTNLAKEGMEDKAAILQTSDLESEVEPLTDANTPLQITMPQFQGFSFLQPPAPTQPQGQQPMLPEQGMEGMMAMQGGEENMLPEMQMQQ